MNMAIDSISTAPGFNLSAASLSIHLGIEEATSGCGLTMLRTTLRLLASGNFWSIFWDKFL